MNKKKNSKKKIYNYPRDNKNKSKKKGIKKSDKYKIENGMNILKKKKITV